MQEQFLDISQELKRNVPEKVDMNLDDEDCEDSDMNAHDRNTPLFAEGSTYGDGSCYGNGCGAGVIYGYFSRFGYVFAYYEGSGSGDGVDSESAYGRGEGRPDCTGEG